MTALTLGTAARAYGRSAYVKARLLRGADLSSAQRAAVRRAINKDVRHFGDLVIPDLLRPLTSRAAVDAARDLGVDLCRQTWASQLSFDTGRASGKFHLEHVVPVDMQVDEIIAATTAAGAGQVLLASRVAWILKVENARLTDGGHSRRRPNPDAAYEGAGIELVDCCPRS
jgi:hypothetical protein